MFFTISVCAKTYVTIFKVIPFAIPNRRYKQIAVAINTKKHSCFFFLVNLEIKIDTSKMKNKLLKIFFQILIFFIMLDRMISQCGIRWRGTCDARSSATSRTYQGWSK